MPSNRKYRKICNISLMKINLQYVIIKERNKKDTHMFGHGKMFSNLFALRRERKADEKFDLVDHLTELTNKYCEGMSEEQKNILIARIRKEKHNKKEVYKLSDLANFPKKSELRNANPKKEPFLKEKKAVQEILERFQENESAVSKDLKAILKNPNVDFKIMIRENWKFPNGSMAIKRGKNGEKDQVVLTVASVMFTEDNKKILPGLLGHEMGHLLDFKNRKTGHKKYMDGAESYADIAGALLARYAGYKNDAFYWGKFMGEAKEKYGISDPQYSPPGVFRQETINKTREFMDANNIGLETDKSAVKPIKENNSLSPTNILSLRGIAAETRAPSKVKSVSKISLENLRYIREGSRKL